MNGKIKLMNEWGRETYNKVRRNWNCKTKSDGLTLFDYYLN